ncbi:hypothetical protein [Solidesulfovibrio carbinolicus]|uniref:hypothetical protein n=1 Tax=Solidesulfovibrio carbinolicus TaxID=296842 RepID=UPI00101354DD|nr:hypothetical protein [Solidesulfovibrio carbinolicus]
MAYTHLYWFSWAALGIILVQDTTPLTKGEPPGQGCSPSGDEQVRDLHRIILKQVNFYKGIEPKTFDCIGSTFVPKTRFTTYLTPPSTEKWQDYAIWKVLFHSKMIISRRFAWFYRFTDELATFHPQDPAIFYAEKTLNSGFSKVQ